MMSYQPTMDTVMAKLEQKGALFALVDTERKLARAVSGGA